jgi:uncharacterized protein (DUF2062 family)
MGIFPVWGFQLIIAIAVSFLFKLNKVLVVIAANISIPPMIPIILFLSHVTGAMWMGSKAQSISFSKGITLVMFQDNLLQYATGAVTLAIAAGVIFASVTFILLKIFKRTKT